MTSHDATERSADRYLTYKQLYTALFTESTEELGEERAVMLLMSFCHDVLVPAPPKRGRPQKTQLKGWDTLLPAMYDARAESTRSGKIRGLAEHMYDHSDLYHSVKALEKRISRLLELRDQGRLVRETLPWGLRL
jgi:hypothetical protein